MSADYRSGSENQSTSNVSLFSVPLPAGVQDGDVLVAVVAWNGNSSTSMAAPSGWTLIGRGTGSAFTSMAYYYRIASAEPASYSWVCSISTYISVQILAFSGGLDKTALVVGSAFGAGDTEPLVAPSVNATRPALLINAFSINGNSNSSSNWSSPSPALNIPLTPYHQYQWLLVGTREVAAGSTGTTSVSGSGAYNGSATLALALSNTPPNAPTVNVASTIDSGASNVITAPFSDPDPGDSCSQTDFQWWDLDGTGARVGAAHTQTVTGAQPTQWTAPAGTFTNGDKEIQAKSYDALGAPSPWGPSAFFTAATPPGAPTITDPTNGGTVGASSYAVTWSVAGGQSGYRVRRVADNAGAADATTIYWDSGQITGSGADVVRSLSVPFETNNHWEHVQVSIYRDGMWSSWADARVDVSYTPPAAPRVTLTPDAANGVLTVGIVNPTPGAGQPATSYNNVYVDDGKGAGKERVATNLPTNQPWTYPWPVSLRDYSGNLWVEAVATNGTTAETVA